jgi:NADPH2:quinone reductase
VRAIVFDEIGPPLEVLYLADVPIPQIKDDEVLVRMVSASINPGDFLFIQNLYPEPKKPKFPRQIAGNHGAGIVERAGANVSIPPGVLVAFSYYNTWAEFSAVPAEWLIPLPEGYPVERAGQLMNPITAWDLLADSGVRPGQWLVLTAGYSSISTMVLQFAKRRGINVISVVRQLHNEINLLDLGAAAVIDLSDPTTNVEKQVKEITGNMGIHGLIDNVGGPVTGDLIRSLAFGGQVVINGGMSEERFALHNFNVLLNGIEIRANIYRYFFAPPEKSDAPVLREIADVFAQPNFMVPLGGVLPLQDFKVGVIRAWNGTGLGKQILKM